MSESFNALIDSISSSLRISPISVKKEIVLTGSCQCFKIHKHHAKGTSSVSIYCETREVLEDLRRDLMANGFDVSTVLCDNMSQSTRRFYLSCEFCNSTAAV